MDRYSGFIYVKLVNYITEMDNEEKREVQVQALGRMLVEYVQL